MWMFVSDYRFFSSHGNAFFTRSSSELWRMWGKVLRTNLGKQKSASFPALLPYVSLPELHLSSAQLFPPKDQHQIFLLYWLTYQFDMWVKKLNGKQKVYNFNFLTAWLWRRNFQFRPNASPANTFHMSRNAPSRSDELKFSVRKIVLFTGGSFISLFLELF